MQDFRIYQRLDFLEKEVDILSRALYDAKQGQVDMLDQIKKLKEKVNDDGSSK